MRDRRNRGNERRPWKGLKDTGHFSLLLPCAAEWLKGCAPVITGAQSTEQQCQAGAESVNQRLRPPGLWRWQPPPSDARMFTDPDRPAERLNSNCLRTLEEANGHEGLPGITGRAGRGGNTRHLPDHVDILGSDPAWSRNDSGRINIWEVSGKAGREQEAGLSPSVRPSPFWRTIRRNLGLVTK